MYTKVSWSNLRPRRVWSAGTAFAAWLVAAGASGCASYHAATVEDLAPNHRVRMTVDPQTLVELVAFVQGQQGQLGGQFLGARGDSAVFRFETPTSYRRVVLHRDAIIELERRESSPVRTVIFSAGVVGGIGLLAYLGFEGRQEGGDPEPPGPEALVPAFIISVPFGR